MPDAAMRMAEMRIVDAAAETAAVLVKMTGMAAIPAAPAEKPEARPGVRLAEKLVVILDAAAVLDAAVTLAVTAAALAAAMIAAVTATAMIGQIVTAIMTVTAVWGLMNAHLIQTAAALASLFMKSIRNALSGHSRQAAMMKQVLIVNVQFPLKSQNVFRRAVRARLFFYFRFIRSQPKPLLSRQPTLFKVSQDLEFF